MTDEELLGALAELARREEEDPLEDPRWDALVAGQASDQDRAALGRLAEEAALGPAALAAFEPLGERAERRCKEALTAALEQPEERPSAGEPGGEVIPLARGTSRAPRRARSRGLHLALASALAAAAAAALVFWLPGRPDGGDLPAYQLEVLGVEEAIRGSAGSSQGELIARRGSRLRLLFRPELPVQGEVAVRAYFLSGKRVVPLGVAAQLSAEGAAQLRLELGRDLELAPGRWELLLLAARPADLPPPAPTVSQLGAGQGRRIQRRWVQILAPR